MCIRDSNEPVQPGCMLQYAADAFKAIQQNMVPYTCLLYTSICVLGNILPVPFLVVFARRVLFWCATWPHIGKYFQKIIDIGNGKIDKLGKYELLGLYLFVAVPLPGTGAWTGCLIATLLQMKLRPAFFSIAAGVMTSGLIMWLASAGPCLLYT